MARGATGLITTPSSVLRLYERAINQGQCDLAAKFMAPSSHSLMTFRRRCRATQHLSVSPLIDPGYRIHRLTATYACLGIHITTRLRNSTVQSSGGWYLLEKTSFAWWHVMLSRSHLVSDGRAIVPSRATCVAALPSYTHASSAQDIVGSNFLSATTGWIALSRSGTYAPNGSCEHGIGTNCDTAQTVIYRTDDGGAHWQRQVSLTTLPESPVWLHFFNRQVGVVAATVGPVAPSSAYHGARSILFRTVNGGKHWEKLPLPEGYSIDTRSISFPDPTHGWLWFGGGAAGSMSVEMYRTGDGGRHWIHIACATFSGAPPGKRCNLHSGIDFGGDKEFLTFSNALDGWLTVFSNGGIPTILHSQDGGRTWRDQRVGLPPGIRPPGPKDTVFPLGTFDAPHLFGREGVLAERVGFYQPKPQANWAYLYLVRSHDAGQTWQFYERVPVPDPSVNQYLDAQHWIFVARSTTWMTNDGGRAWTRTPLHLPQGLQLTALSFTDPRRGWALAEPHGQIGGLDAATALLHTNDGGRTWSKLGFSGTSG